MQSALVIGASGGIGSAVAARLEAAGGQVTRLSRSGHGLDVTDEASIKAALGALDGPYELIFVATGVLSGAGHPPEKSLSALTREALTDQFAVNAIGPALVLKHGLRLMPRKGRSVFAALSARVGSIGDNHLGGWYAYRSAKAALNQILHGAAIEVARKRPDAIVAALHPGTVDTPFTAGYDPSHGKLSPDEAAGHLLSVIGGLTPADTGGFFDWKGARVPW